MLIIAQSHKSPQCDLKKSFVAKGKTIFNKAITSYTFRKIIPKESKGAQGMTDGPFERRKTKRCYALNLLDYEIVGPSGEVLGQGLARTLNIGKDGLRLETDKFFEVGQKVRITLGLQNDLVQITGRVVNSIPENNELCSTGIAFVVFEEHDRQVYQQYFDNLQPSKR